MTGAHSRQGKQEGRFERRDAKGRQASVVTIYQDAGHPTSILLPVMRDLPPIWGTPPACGEVVGEICVTPEV